MIPEKIKISRREDWHTHFVGHYDNGKIFLGFPFFGGLSQTRPLAVLHLLNEDGLHISSEIWETEKMYMAEQELKLAVQSLNGYKYENVMVRCFTVELNGLTFGLVADQELERVSYMPYDLAFFAPWDGTYDT